MKTIDAGVLSVAYNEYGPADGWPCMLGHGFPYDPHAYSDAAPILAEAGARVIVPYLRGFGPTRFLSAGTPRSGEQAALGADLLALMDALDDATLERTASAFDNFDFVEVVIHSYRHRYGLVAGDPAYAEIEAALAAQPPIAIPTITIDGDADGVNPGTKHHVAKFAGKHEHRIFRDAGHNLPQERPEERARAVIDAWKMATG